MMAEARPTMGDIMPKEPQLVEAVATHEHLPAEAARDKVARMLGESWGPPAIRQMIRDEIDEAMAASRWPEVDDLLDTYQWCCRHLPFGTERRVRRLQ